MTTSTTITPETIKKHPDETLNISIDFTYRLAVGEAITSATGATVGTGTIVTGASPSVASPVVTAVVSGGTADTTDSFQVDATTDAGEVLVGVVNVAVSITDF